MFVLILFYIQVYVAVNFAESCHFPRISFAVMTLWSGSFFFWKRVLFSERTKSLVIQIFNDQNTCNFSIEEFYRVSKSGFT